MHVPPALDRRRAQLRAWRGGLLPSAGWCSWLVQRAGAAGWSSWLEQRAGRDGWSSWLVQLLDAAGWAAASCAEVLDSGETLLRITHTAKLYTGWTVSEVTAPKMLRNSDSSPQNDESY